MGKKLAKLFEMIEDIEIAMMTTRREDGHLVSRAMATQKRAPGADLWFVTDESAEKLREIEFDPHVNLAFYKDRTREWVSISGVATISRDRRKIRQLYGLDWRAWFPENGDPRHGTPDDPRMVLIGVKIHSGFFLEINKPQPVILYELVKGILTKEFPKLGIVKEVGENGTGTRSPRAGAKKKASGTRSTSASKSSGGAKPAARRGATAAKSSSRRKAK